jgi:hypothetical protein
VTQVIGMKAVGIVQLCWLSKVKLDSYKEEEKSGRNCCWPENSSAKHCCVENI